MSNLALELASEIARVAELRGNYAALDGMAGINVRPVMTMIDQALDLARAAMAGGDVAEMINAIRELRALTS